MSKHTPGPWTASQYVDDGKWGVVTRDGGIIVSTRSMDGGLLIEDARLIAAAPDLLDLLICLRDEWFEPHYGHNDVGMAALLRNKIRAAIAKAEGK